MLKTRPTYDEHRDLGDRLQAMNLEMVQGVFMKLQAAYGRSSRAARLARKAAVAMQELRCELDDRACCEYPMAQYPDLEPHRLYLGKSVYMSR